MARHPRLSLVTRITFGCLAHGTSGVWRPTRERLSKVVGAPSRPSVLSDDQVNNALVKGAELGLLDELSEPELIILAGCRGAAGL